MISDHISGQCDCRDLIEQNDTVIVPDFDSIGTVRVLMEHSAEVEISETGESYTYKLADLHLADSYQRAISEADRKLAEETFGLIERSEASGNSYEANLPIGTDDDEFGPVWEDGRYYTHEEASEAEIMAGVTLADHTDSPSANEVSVNKLMLSLTPTQWDLAVDALQYGADESTDPDWAQDCSDLAVSLREALEVAWPGSHGKPGVTLADHTDSAIAKILGA